jgi:hypothetical protein
VSVYFWARRRPKFRTPTKSDANSWGQSALRNFTLSNSECLGVLEELRGRKTVSPSQWRLSPCLRDSDGNGLDPCFENSPQPVSAGLDLMLQSFSGLITTNGRSLQRLRCSGNSTPLSSWNKAHTRIACVMQPTTVEAHAFASASASRGGWAAGQRLLVICGGRVTLRTQCPCRAKTYKGLSPA